VHRVGIMCAVRARHRHARHARWSARGVGPRRIRSRRRRVLVLRFDWRGDEEQGDGRDECDGWPPKDSEREHRSPK
jgi:hypothetical protein